MIKGHFLKMVILSNKGEKWEIFSVYYIVEYVGSRARQAAS